MTTGRRTLLATCAALGAGAAALWGAAALTWYSGATEVPVRGSVPVTVTGAEVAPALTAVALLGLAGIAALVATGGLLRRMVGVLVTGAGAGAAVLAVDRWTRPRVPPEALPSGVASVGDLEPTAAPLLAVAGGVLLVAAGLVTLVGAHRMPRLGARYTAHPASTADQDPDRAAWDALDAGRDPTVEPLPDHGGGGQEANGVMPDDRAPSRDV